MTPLVVASYNIHRGVGLDRALEGGQQARLLGARSDPLGEVRE